MWTELRSALGNAWRAPGFAAAAGLTIAVGDPLVSLRSE
jgi:hypothetical protein